MQKVNLTLAFDDEKLRALETYLKMGNSSIQKKLEEAMEQLYEQTVPKPVQEYVDAISGGKGKRPSPTTAKPKPDIKKEAKPDEQS